jgi:hypothetical protein
MSGLPLFRILFSPFSGITELQKAENCALEIQAQLLPDAAPGISSPNNCDLHTLRKTEQTVHWSLVLNACGEDQIGGSDRCAVIE